MKALFLCDFQHGYPVLPPMEADTPGAVQLHFTEGGILKGGYSMVGLVPQATSAIVQIEASDAAIVMMAADPRYLFLEEVVDAPTI